MRSILRRIKRVLLLPFLLLRWAGRAVMRCLLACLLTPWTNDELRQSAIVFAPHQDDETLGPGATIIRKKQAGADVKVVFLTDGSASHAGHIAAAELRAIREQEASAACAVLGVPRNDVEFLGFPDGRLKDCEEEAIARIVDIVRREQPAQVFIPYYQDGSPDHWATTRSVQAALETAGCTADIYEYPTWFWCYWPWIGLPHVGKLKALRASLAANASLLREFRSCVPVGDLLEQKRKALAAHRSQLEPIRPVPDWFVLGNVANGDWLACFFQPREIFYRHGLQKAAERRQLPVPLSEGK